MTKLLVSVRSVAEVEAALQGGASLIDVKEPANGPLGKADDGVIADVVRSVAGRAPVSAAIGEWKAADFSSRSPVLPGLNYVKFGLAGSGHDDWQGFIDQTIRTLAERCYPGAIPVVAAYADWERADSPSVDDVCEYAREQAGGVFLLDTYVKGAGQTLLDCLALPKLALLCDLCRAVGVQIALAGSVGTDEIRKLLPLQPDWIAVRGAACEGGRNGVVSAAKVRELATLINQPRRES
jgi:(5-formylfuran-3-yl)methyl phosphate synthase